MRVVRSLVSICVAGFVLGCVATVIVRGGATQIPNRIVKFVDGSGGLGSSNLRESDDGNMAIGANPKESLRLLVNGPLGARGASSGTLGAFVVSRDGTGPIATFRSGTADVRLAVDDDGIDVDGAIRVAGADVIDDAGRFVGTGVQKVNPMRVALNRWFAVNESGYRRNLNGGAVTGVAFDGQYVWACLQLVDRVTRVRASDGERLGSFDVGGNPIDLVCDGGNIWVISTSDRKLTKLRAYDGMFLDEFVMPDTPLCIEYDGRHLWVALVNGDVLRVSTDDGSVVDTVAAGSIIRGLEFDGTFLWTTNSTDDTVSKIRASDATVVETLALGDGPWGVIFDGSDLWISFEAEGTVKQIDRSTGEIRRTVAVGGVPRNVGFDGDNIVVAGSVSNGFGRIPLDGGSSESYDIGLSPNGEFAFDGANIWLGAGTTLLKL